ncbi:MAG: Rrf2 family transcriptional regulator [Elusimicrobia bacterium]|nr:Rrf2 family transcriptional regulator [Elusimicrobiota bacterium]
MKLITRNTDYAIRILVTMARRQDEACSTAGYIHRDLGISLSFVRKIMQQLGKRGLLKSCKGKGGGFRIGRPPQEINIIEIITATQGPLRFNDCDDRPQSCRNWHTCLMRGALKEVERCVNGELNKITLASLVAVNKVLLRPRIPVKMFTATKR